MKNRKIAIFSLIIFVLLLFIIINNKTNIQNTEILEQSNETSNENNNKTTIDTPDSNEKKLYELFYNENRESNKNEISILLKDINFMKYCKIDKNAHKFLEWIDSFESYDEEQIAGIINLATSVDGEAATMLSIITYKIYFQDMLYFVDILSRYDDDEELIEKNSLHIYHYASMRDFEDKVIGKTKALLKNEELTPDKKELIEKMVTYMEKYKHINTF